MIVSNRLYQRYILDKKEKQIIDKESGEVHTSKEDILNIIENNKAKNREDKIFEKELIKLWNLQPNIEPYQKNWKEKSWFIKIYRTERREFFKQNKLSVNASALLLHIEGYTQYKTNRLAGKQGKDLSNKELQDISGLSPVQLKKALNELEDLHIIKRVGNRQARKIYINPYIISAGNEVLLSTKELFKEYKPLTPY